MSVQKKPSNPVRFPPNPELEQKVEQYLREHKDALTTGEVAAQIGEAFNLTDRALYNLRSADKVRIITFQTNEIHWIHMVHLRR